MVASETSSDRSSGPGTTGPPGWRMPAPGPTGVAELARAVVAVVVLAAWVLLPDQQAGVLVAAGLAALALAGLEAYAATRLEPRGRGPALLRALGPLAGGVTLILVAQDTSVYRLAVGFGVLLVVRGIADLIGAGVVGRRAGILFWLLGLGLAEAGGGLLALGRPELFGQAVVALIGLAWLAGAVVAVLAPPPPMVRRFTTAPYLERSQMDEAEHRRIEDEVSGIGQRRVARFLVLLSMSAVIATFGLLSNSVAAVIGAMIVAPLMLPIQGLTAGLVAGRRRDALGSAALLASGIVTVYLISMVIGTTALDLAFDLANASIQARTSPTLADLGIALAAGTVGGFALVRADVAASVPGVAIAVSLVPPLCTSGVTLAGGDGGAAWGAFLLFAINFVAIVAAVGGVLILAGYGAAGVAGRWLLAVGAVVAVVLGLLSTPLAETERDNIDERALSVATTSRFTAWAEPIQPARLLAVEVDGWRVSVLFASADEPPPGDDLEAAIEDDVKHDVTLELSWVQAEPR
ncbi:DUF389 domain-containing protein [Nocardioides sp. GY 10113]|uniref:DUF389 domain-containing protein n=1 Tax=Nocardioides sp. GY 10113 TaxID=2569761 RepID=UPI0010A81BC0|nr:DUF389 domain-containing protein [Nocardioides sp. GY 10113]TIC88099.1 DUF389 domain-containing protein [Nocardioides sp. GY 10113]